jgi:cytochrome c biogenesis protein CcmG/thiol:disulfide interchange protein DsbE
VSGLDGRTLAVAAGAAVGALLLAALAWGLLHPASPGAGGSVLGKPAPDLMVQRLNGSGVVRLSELRGRPVVLNFWASWCASCQQEEPTLKATAQALESRVSFLGVDFKDSTSAAQNYLAGAGYPYPIGAAVGGIPASYGVTAPPDTYFIGSDGVVVARFRGPLDRSLMDRYLGLVGVS